ncbi:MAG: ABC transporter ATP-binding protein [Acidiferrobacterales bacterium]
MADSLIVAEGVSKYFGDIAAVDDIHFTVERASTTALLGGNGAGKTTTLAILLGLLIPSRGHIIIFGCNVLQNRYRVLPRMNFSSPYVDLPYRLTVRENLTVYAQLYGLRNARQRIRKLADELDLSGLMRRTYGQLSAGQKTRVALAKALLNEPELLLLDEPTASLDPDTADYVRGYLESYKHQAGTTILMASHNMSEVERLCDDVIMLRSGRIVDRGRPEALLARYGRQNMEEVFIDIARERYLSLPTENQRVAKR